MLLSDVVMQMVFKSFGDIFCLFSYFSQAAILSSIPKYKTIEVAFLRLSSVHLWP